jgi:uncharacterized protein
MPITALYAGLLALMLVVLSFRVIGVRRSEKISLGDGENRDLLARIRVHANFTEYVPIALLLIALLESMKTPSWALHTLGSVLILGRLAHAYGVSRKPQVMTMRVAGMVATLTVIMVGASACLWLASQRLI